MVSLDAGDGSLPAWVAAWAPLLLRLLLAAVALAMAVLFIENAAHRRALAHSARIDRQFEPLLTELIIRDPTAAEYQLASALSRRDRDALLGLCLRIVAIVRGDGVDRLRGILVAGGALDVAVDGLRSWRWWVRVEACRSVGRLGHRAAVPTLVRCLRDRVPAVRRSAALALGRLRAIEAVDPLLDAAVELGGWSATELAIALREFGADALPIVTRRLGAPAPLPVLRAMLTVVGHLHAAVEVEPIVALAAHPQLDIRVEAVRTLGRIQAEPPSVAACRTALGDRAWQVRAAAARALGILNDAEAIPALMAAMLDDSYWVRHHAAEALGRLRADGHAALVAQLGHENRFVRDMARQVLAMAPEAAR